MSAFVWPVRVYVEDTDFGGVVFYGNYLKYFERARTEWLRSLGVNQNAMMDEKELVFVVREINVQYRAPARLDDELKLTVQVEKLGRASVHFIQEAWRDDRLLARAAVQVVSVSTPDFRPTGIPPDIWEKMHA